METSLRRASLFAFFACAAAILYLALTPVPDHPVLSHGDKLNHALAFFVLGSLGSIAWPASARALLGGLAGYGVLIELLQWPVPGHHADPLDVVADLVGAVLAMGLLRAWRAWATRTRVSPTR